MPISLETLLSPSVTLRSIGEYVNGHVCHISLEPLYEFGSRRPKLTADGRPRSQERVTLLVTGGTGQVRNGEVYRPVQVGEEVVIWLQGGRRWSWIEAKRKAGGLDVGDVVQIKYSMDEPGQGAQPKKVWTVSIRKPAAKDQDGLARAEAIYHRLHAAPSRPTLEEIEPEEDDRIPF